MRVAGSGTVVAVEGVHRADTENGCDDVSGLKLMVVRWLVPLRTHSPRTNWQTYSPLYHLVGSKVVKANGVVALQIKSSVHPNVTFGKESNWPLRPSTKTRAPRASRSGNCISEGCEGEVIDAVAAVEHRFARGVHETHIGLFAVDIDASGTRQTALPVHNQNGAGLRRGDA